MSHNIAKVLGLLLVLCAVSTQASTTYYASPSASNLISCTQELPCSLKGAIQLAQDNDIVIMLEGTYNDPTIFPIVITNGITLRGVVPDSVIVDCSTNGTGICLEVVVPIDRFFNVFVNDVVFQHFYPTASLHHGDLSATVLVRAELSSTIPEFELAQGVTFTSTSFFNNSAPVDPNKQPWQYPSVVLVMGLPQSASVAFENSVFSGNDIEVFRTLYSSLVLQSCTINNNNQAVENAYSTVLSAAIHPWIGGSSILIDDCLIASNDGFADLITVSGVRCLNASYCAGLIIASSNIQVNRGKNGITLYDGASLTVRHSNFFSNFFTDKSLIYSHQAVTESRLLLDDSVFEDNTLAFGNTVNGLVEGSWSSQSSINSCNFTSLASENAAILARGSLLVTNSSFNYYNGLYVLEDSTVTVNQCSFNGTGSLVTAVGSEYNIAGSTIVSLVNSTFNVVDTKETPSTAISTKGYVNALVSGSTFNDGKLLANCSLEGVTFSSLVQFVGNKNSVKKNDGSVKENAQGCQVVCNSPNKDICNGQSTVKNNTHGTKGMPIWLQVCLPISFFLFGVFVIVVGVFLIRRKSLTAALN